MRNRTTPTDLSQNGSEFLLPWRRGLPGFRTLPSFSLDWGRFVLIPSLCLRFL